MSSDGEVHRVAMRRTLQGGLVRDLWISKLGFWTRKSKDARGPRRSLGRRAAVQNELLNRDSTCPRVSDETGKFRKKSVAQELRRACRGRAKSLTVKYAGGGFCSALLEIVSRALLVSG